MFLWWLAALSQAAGLFGDGMVLQRDKPIPVWGRAAPGAGLELRFAGQTRRATAGADGRWSVEFDPVPAGGPHDLVVEGASRQVFRDVLVGEVWGVIGGGSFETPLKDSRVALTLNEEQARRIRVCRVTPASADRPLQDVRAVWSPKDPAVTGESSAIAYLFAVDLMERLKTPVGLVQATAADQPIEQWISLQGLGRTRASRQVSTMYRIRAADYVAGRAQYLYFVQEAKKRGEDPDKIPVPVPPSPPGAANNAMIAPLAPFAMRGLLWDQGTTDLHHGQSYGQFLEALIQDLRGQWGQSDLAMAWMQYGAYGAPSEAPPANSLLADLREGQAKALSNSRTGMVVRSDLGPGRERDPRTLREISRRLGLWARAEVYGEDVLAGGPVFESMKVELDRIRVKFAHAGSGLTSGEEPLRGFTLSGEFHVFVPAQARIEGDTVLVWSDEVRWPAAVRYGWSDCPTGNLSNREGLPAAPFRSDAWPRR
jgi:sialate O-acetylesterase